MPCCRVVCGMALATLAGCAAGGALTENQRNLERLAIGMTGEEVDAVMGPETRSLESRPDAPTGALVGRRSVGGVPNPARTEVHEAGGHTFIVLFYYTEMKTNDGVITTDEVTPVVLKDGVVDGIGWSHWNALVEKYEIGSP
jgi:hypothetical protein